MNFEGTCVDTVAVDNADSGSGHMHLECRNATLPGMLELPTLRLTASRSNQLSYGSRCLAFQSQTAFNRFRKGSVEPSLQFLHRYAANTLCDVQQIDPGRTRTCNLWFRRPTPYPLGHRANQSIKKPPRHLAAGLLGRAGHALEVCWARWRVRWARAGGAWGQQPGCAGHAPAARWAHSGDAPGTRGGCAGHTCWVCQGVMLPGPDGSALAT